MRYLSVLLLCACFTTAIAQKKEPVKVTDMLRIRQAGSVSFSSDARQVVFMATSIEPDGDNRWEYKYSNQLFIAPADGSSAPRQLTFRDNAMQPAWSPDGRQLAFVRPVDGKTQVFLLPLDGGEPAQLTFFRYGASAPKWSPDGKKILFAASVPLKELLKDSALNPARAVPAWPFEKPGFAQNEQLRSNAARPDPDGNMDEIRAYLDNNVADRKAKVITKLNFQEEATTSGDLSFTHFFTINTSPGSQPVPVTKGFYRFTGAEFTPDGRQLLISGNMDPLRHPDRVLESELYLADADGSNIRKLLGEAGKTFNSARISPSGKWIAFQYGSVGFVDVPALGIIPVNGSAKDIVTIPFDRSKGGLSWSEDEKYLYFTAQSNGGAPVYRADIKSRQVDALSGTNAGISSFDYRNGKLVFVKTEVANPFEVYTSDAAMKNPVRISNLNTGWLEGKTLSMPEKGSFVNNKGQTIEYWVMKPANYQPGKKYPAIVNIHGGPTAMWGPGESSMWHEFQYYTARGFAVVYCNPRGSGGYGASFLQANLGDWGAGPASDVLTALDRATAGGFIDTSRLAVTGGSYAGYLVAWIIAHDQRFKAACSQRGVYDLATFFGEGNAWRLVPNYFGGYPWEEKTRELIKRESPINYVEQIHTPYLIFHGENDLRTGVIQSEMLYRSLKVLGRTVEYVRHPGGTHELTRSGNNRQRIDQMLRTIEFFERFISTK
ncbi:S9 family peptidase [Sediminibacterium ginsengisoli]|uniref:Dipeptidyl aminopeptidase/acylaminoacyl peptidase n=1 Tax=Sediminibacterium ginsengisoli TaxID=413434 RepID=A0A1T4LX14_9BACT|nr:S9 family peptidase [Sediminibacterium ginsengisoli]SJZ59197.1 Dipeptidyl aminopeptidase/acylaminoacyl peptidase [Sediminibacterium ginsengisoli]